LIVARQLIRLDVPVMIAVSLATCAMAIDGVVERWEGGLLVFGAVVYTVGLIRIGRRDAGAIEVKREAPKVRSRWWLDMLLIAIGLLLLLLGARWLVQAAVSVAVAMGVSELVIGLTIVAIGTSMPELATSILATVRGQRELAVGNVIGSNIFNLLLVLDTCAAISPDGIAVSDAAIRFDLPVMAVVAVACLPIFFSGHRIERWEGALFFCYYVAYTAYLLMQAAHHDALPTFSSMMISFVLPLTLITLLVLAVRGWRHRNSGDPS
jgi:cation:H+ antiporter